MKIYLGVLNAISNIALYVLKIYAKSANKDIHTKGP